MDILKYIWKFIGYLLSCVIFFTIMPIETSIYFFMHEFLNAEFNADFKPLFNIIVDFIAEKTHLYDRES